MIYSVKETAKRLRISTSLVYVLVQRGELACHRIGTGRGIIRISDDQITRYLRRARKKTSSRRFHAETTHKEGDIEPVQTGS